LITKFCFLYSSWKNNLKLRTGIIPRHFKNKFNQWESFLQKISTIIYNLMNLLSSIYS
jgi:hypothetical protein